MPYLTIRRATLVRQGTFACLAALLLVLPASAAERPEQGETLYNGIELPHVWPPRLALLPDSFVRPLETVQFSQMTAKKRSFPCYGMQWGTALYLYPIEETLVEYFDRPPRPNLPRHLPREPVAAVAALGPALALAARACLAGRLFVPGLWLRRQEAHGAW